MKSLYSIKFIFRIISLIIFTTFVYAGIISAAEPVKTPAGTQKTAPAAKETQPKEKVSPLLDPNDPKSILYLDTKGKLAALAGAVLPKDRYGLVDWAKAVKDKVISPRPSLDPKEEEMPAMDMNVVIEAKSDFVNDVVYPHYMHTWWLKCEVCHPAIFVPAKGQNNMTMSAIVEGKFCGRCHGKVAFPLADCNRCHTQPKKAAKK